MDPNFGAAATGAFRPGWGSGEPEAASIDPNFCCDQGVDPDDAPLEKLDLVCQQAVEDGARSLESGSGGHQLGGKMSTVGDQLTQFARDLARRDDQASMVFQPIAPQQAAIDRVGFVP